MDDKKIKLQESIRSELAKQGSDFLVPFISSVINLLTSHEIENLFRYFDFVNYQMIFCYQL